MHTHDLWPEGSALIIKGKLQYNVLENDHSGDNPAASREHEGHARVRSFPQLYLGSQLC